MIAERAFKDDEGCDAHRAALKEERFDVGKWNKDAQRACRRFAKEALRSNVNKIAQPKKLGLAPRANRFNERSGLNTKKKINALRIQKAKPSLGTII